MRFASATLLTLLAGTAIADPAPASLAVVVRGAPDPAGVRARIASELATPIAAVDRCAGACLEIAITGTSANVAYTTGSGVTRARQIELGSEPAQWPIVIALLAGNLARDEAADVLAQLPAPPDPAPAPVDDGPVLHPEQVVIPPPLPVTRPPAPAPVVDVLYERREEGMVAIGFLPVLSTDGLRLGRVRHAVSFHVLAGLTGGSELLSFSGLVDVQRGIVEGVQVGGLVAAARDLRGVQLGGLVAVAERSGGVQLGGVAAISNQDADVQLGGTATLARGRARFQLAGVAAVADRAETQLGGIVALARGDSQLQVGGIATASRTAHVQVAGIANIADRVRGLQLGTVNVARRVEGVQVGVINIGGDAGGESFGLINIVPGGRTDLEATIDSDQIGAVLFRHGGQRWHNVYAVAGQQVDEQGGASNDIWMYGLGFGPSWRGLGGRIDVELMGWQVNHGAAHSTDVSILGQLRATYAHELGGVSVVAGGALNAYISNDRMSPLAIERRTESPDPDIGVTVWPSAFVGVRL